MKNVSSEIVEIPAGGFGVTPLEQIELEGISDFYGNINDIHKGIEFIGGDENDMVTLARLVVGADFCCGFKLGPQGTCVYSVFFNTADNNKPLSDTNSGLWRIHTTVGFFVPSQPFQQNAHGSAMVEVLDPNATPTLPEPPTVVLVVAGLTTLGGIARKWRH